MENQSNLPTLNYWAGIRGYGAYVVQTFEAAGQQYNYNKYTDYGVWMSDKASSQIILPNLPNIVDGDVQVAEHDACVRYVARKYKPELLGTTQAEQANVDMVHAFWIKLNLKARNICYNKDVTTEERIKVIADQDASLQRLNDHYNGKKFLLGD